VLVAFNAPSLARFGPKVQPGGTVVYDSSVIAEVPPLPQGVKVVGVPFTRIAAELGKPVVKNVVALGALQEATRLFPKETFLTVIRQALREKSALIPLNETAFERGAEAARALTA
jgi:Pyruvate/2-oxoacid:ferredoxin oxidoreductase gamma subunit